MRLGGQTALASAALLGVTVFVHGQVSEAEQRLSQPAAAQKVEIAQEAQLGYCTPQFMEVLQRVLGACGLVQGGARRGCMPEDVRRIASISDADFNALFAPLQQRGAVILFDEGKFDLDASGQAMLDKLFPDRRGARYFIAVARASRTGTAKLNEALSHKRVNSVLFYLKQKFADDPDLDNEVGLLWLGDTFAQLAPDYCAWPTTRPDVKCDGESINRSVFVSWIDCRL